jgi:hypothetical protein
MAPDQMGEDARTNARAYGDALKQGDLRGAWNALRGKSRLPEPPPPSPPPEVRVDVDVDVNR